MREVWDVLLPNTVPDSHTEGVKAALGIIVERLILVLIKPALGYELLRPRKLSFHVPGRPLRDRDHCIGWDQLASDERGLGQPSCHAEKCWRALAETLFQSGQGVG